MTELTEIKGVGDSFADNFRQEGFESVEEVVDAEISDLTEVKRVSQERAVNILENAEEIVSESVEDDSEEFDLVEEESPKEEEETSTDDDERVSEDSDDKDTLQYEFESEWEYEWFKYVLKDEIIDGRKDTQAEKVLRKVLDNVVGRNYNIDIELDGGESSALRRTFSTHKREFQNNRKPELMKLCRNILNEL